MLEFITNIFHITKVPVFYIKRHKLKAKITSDLSKHYIGLIFIYIGGNQEITINFTYLFVFNESSIIH